MKFKYLILFILLFTSISIHAQWDAQISQYWRLKNYYNPSFAGETNNIEASLLHRRQWAGMENAPTTSIISVTMPLQLLNKEHGVGVMVINDKIGLFSNTFTQGQYTYKQKFKNNRKLNIGIQASLVNIGFDATKIKTPEDENNSSGSSSGSSSSGSGGSTGSTDPAIPTGIDAQTFDFALGVSWTTPNYYIGFSVNHISKPSFALDETHSSSINRSYYLLGGYNIKLRNPLFVLQPSALVKTDEITYQVDVTARIVYNNMFNGGITWRKDDGFVLLLGAKFKNIDAGYSYDLSTSAISKASKGTHEFFVRYNIPIERKKVSNRRQKSVRLL